MDFRDGHGSGGSVPPPTATRQDSGWWTISEGTSRVGWPSCRARWLGARARPRPAAGGSTSEREGGTVNQTRLKESAEYTARREELRRAEIELMRQRERVASMRRLLPPDTAVEDYSFQEGPRRLEDGDGPVSTVRLRELFSS